MAENTKPQTKKLRLNIIDFLIIIVVIGAVVGIALRMGVVERVTNQSNLEEARISFLIQDIQESSADYFKTGDIFYADGFDCEFGKLESRQFMPAEAFITNMNGELIKTHSSNNRIDVRGTVIGAGTFTDEGFLLEGINFIAPGSGMHIQSTELSFYVTITGIERVSKAS